MSSEAATSRDVHIGRQPVHDRDLAVVAYELHFQHFGTAALEDDPASVFLASMIDIGLERLAAGLPVVIALPESLLLDGTFAHLPADKVILDVRPGTDWSVEVQGIVAGARHDGLRVRIADPIQHPELAPLGHLADIVAIDASALTPEELRTRRTALVAPGRQLLATGVHTHELHADCQSAGFDLFTGRVLSTPNVVSGKRLPTNKMTLLHLTTLLASPTTTVDDLEAAVASNVELSYQVLRYVNSAFIGLKSQVDSVRRAIVLLGPPILRQIVSLLLLQDATDKPAEVTRLALTRARMCDFIGEALGDGRPAYHTVGLLSTVDLLTDVALEEALSDLPLTPEVLDALLHHEGKLGRVLQVVKLYERCDWDDPAFGAFDPMVLSEAYMRALAWTEEAMAAMAEVRAS